MTKNKGSVEVEGNVTTFDLFKSTMQDVFKALTKDAPREEFDKLVWEAYTLGRWCGYDVGVQVDPVSEELIRVVFALPTGTIWFLVTPFYGEVPDYNLHQKLEVFGNYTEEGFIYVPKS